MQKTIYLDNNATTQVSKEVLDEMLPFFSEKYGNASSMHTFGGQNKRVIETARAQTAKLVGANSANEIIFTAGGTEADNTAIFSAVNTQTGRNHIITSAVEHPAVLEPFKYLQSRGVKVDFIGVDKDGVFDMEQFKKVITDKTALVSTMWANSETGTLFPVKEIAEIAHAHGALFHTDAVQAAGKIPVSVTEINADMASFSSHKIHGPKGVGALYVKSGTRFLPYLIGGHQERNKRAGTENVPGIVGLGKAAELAPNSLKRTAQIAALRDHLEGELAKKIPDTKINGDVKNRLPNTSYISFGYVEGEAILLHLDRFGICASSGSACTSGSLEPSHVLRAMCVDYNFAHGSVRFSLSDRTTAEEIDYVIKTMPPVIEELRRISPFWKKNK